MVVSIKRVFILLDPLHEPRSRQGLPLSWGGELNGLALCAGFGGLEGGLERSLPEYRTVCYVEGEAYPAAVIAQKMEKGTVRKAPIWSNVITFDGKPWRGKVDIISGGFPCQPHSKAGKLLGKDDPRNLWPQIVRIAREIRPRFMFLENVANINNTYGKEIVGDLAQMGFDAAWCVVRASDVGAPHRRARWFLLASNSNNSPELIKSMYGSLKGSSELEEVVCDSNGDGFGKHNHHEKSGERVPCQRKLAGYRSKDIGSTDTDSERLGFSTQQPNTPKRQLEVEWSCHVADSDHRHNNKEQKIFARGNRIIFGDWWKVEPPVGRMVDGVAHWSHRIRGCGNGVVPQQAAYAFELLLGGLNGKE